MTETITRPSADVATRVLRDRLVVVAGAAEQVPEGPMHALLVCARDTYAVAISELSRGTRVVDLVAALHVSSAYAHAAGSHCCSASHDDVLSVLGD